MHVADRP